VRGVCVCVSEISNFTSRKKVLNDDFTLFGAKFWRSHPAARAPIRPISQRKRDFAGCGVANANTATHLHRHGRALRRGAGQLAQEGAAAAAACDAMVRVCVNASMSESVRVCGRESVWERERVSVRVCVCERV
jgi:hypothetical protein